MTKILDITWTSNGTSAVKKNITSASDIWVTFDVWTDSDYYLDLLTLYRSGGASFNGLYRNETPGFVLWTWESWDPVGSIGTNTWYHVEYRYAAGTPQTEQVFLNSVDQAAYTETNKTYAAVSVGFGGSSIGGTFTRSLKFKNIKIGTTRGGTDLWDGTLGATAGATFDTVTTAGGSTITIDAVPDRPAPADPPNARVLIALDDDRLTWDPVWYPVDSYQDNLVTGFDIVRGRQTEEDTTDTSTAVVYLNDWHGLFDPGSLESPFAGFISKQIMLNVYDPVALEWVQQARMWIDDVTYDFNPAGVVSNVQLHCVDIFDLLGRMEMDLTTVTGNRVFGNAPPSNKGGIVFYEDTDFQSRITQILDDCGLGVDWYVAFTGNVDVLEGVYDPGDSPLTALREAVDAELPGIANAYSDKRGRFCAHGRRARFDPDAVSLAAGADAWNFQRWKAGDGDAIDADPTRAQLRPPLTWSYQLSRVKNVGYCYPANIREASKYLQFYKDDTSITAYGRRTWRAENLLTKTGTTTGNTGKVECLLYAQFWVERLKDPMLRIESVTVMSIDATDARASATWGLMLGADISDVINIEHSYPGGVGVSGDYYVEGSNMTVRPLNGSYDHVTITFNVSSADVYVDDIGLLG